jgi:ribosomal protein S18 acetylase RimI-like enzyme
MRPLTSGVVERLPSECVGCAFWESEQRLPRHCGALCDPELATAWARDVIEQWGDCGRVAYDDEHIIGFIKYAPPGFMPQARHFPAAPPSDDAVFIGCLHVVDDARHLGLGRLLLHACLRDVFMRGEKAVEAYAYAGQVRDLPVMSLDFLLKQGFEIVRPHQEFPLLRVRMNSLATLTENIEAVLQSLHLPLRVPKRAPAPYIGAKD